MMSLTKPAFAFADVIGLCENGITGNSELRQRFNNTTGALVPLESVYENAALTAKLHTMNVLDTSTNPDPIVIGELSKSDFDKLYTQYFAGGGKPARVVYDKIMNAALDDCPFCGGIGTPSNLDHFLPQAYFPQFSILAINLVPACRDCNMEYKRKDYPHAANQQFLQPYLDQQHFFENQWVFAEYHGDLEGEPGVFEYFVQAPQNWSETDKHRVEKHFSDFDIAVRYAKQAGKQLKTVLSQIKMTLDMGVPKDQVIDALLRPGIQESEFVNHWQGPMYQALIARLQQVP